MSDQCSRHDRRAQNRVDTGKQAHSTTDTDAAEDHREKVTALETGINADIRQKQLDNGNHDQHDRADGFHFAHDGFDLVFAGEHRQR